MSTRKSWGWRWQGAGGGGKAGGSPQEEPEYAWTVFRAGNGIDFHLRHNRSDPTSRERNSSLPSVAPIGWLIASAVGCW